MARHYFGTDGVRGVVGETLTADLVEGLGKAAALWSGRGRVFMGRDTRASGPALEAAFAQGVASAGGTAVLAGVLPTPAVALLRLDLAAVVSASHNPPEYNGVKFFDHEGRKLTDDAEVEPEERNGGRREDPGEDCGSTRRGDAVRERVFQLGAAGARVAPDEDPPPAAPEGGRFAELFHQLGGERLADDSADAVCSEVLPRHGAGR